MHRGFCCCGSVHFAVAKYLHDYLYDQTRSCRVPRGLIGDLLRLVSLLANVERYYRLA